jgi:MscS family membrane protein
LLSLLPKIGQDNYLGFQLWQLIGLMALILLGVVFHKLFTWLTEELLFRILARYGFTNVGRKYILPVAKPFSYFLLIALALIFVRVLQLPIDYARVIITILNILQPLLGAIVFYKLVDVLGSYMMILAERTESTLDDQLVPLLRKTLKFFVIIVGGLVILREGLNVDIWPILTGLSIGGLALALAAQDTLKNFFGSIMIFIDKPFQVGHWVTSGDIDGTVEEVGFRSTRIRTFRNSLTYVPNAKLADSTIDNHGLRQYRRFYTTITITYDTPPAVVEVFVEGLRAIVLRHPDTRKDYFNVFFNDLGSHSLNIMFYVFFAVPTWPEELRARHEVLIEIMKLAEELGVRFAFPTQTLFVEEVPGQSSLTPQFPQNQEDIKSRLTQYLNKQETKESS